MSSQVSQLSEGTKEHPFVVEIGQEAVQLPHGFAKPAKVWLNDLRGRRVYLYQISKEAFEQGGRRYRFSSQEMPVHLRGMPMFFKVEDQRLYLWPVPAHRWTGVVTK